MNEYGEPAVTLVEGVPEIVGGRLATTIENAGRDADNAPSLTLIVMLADAPIWLPVGVPESCPVELLNVAHAGLPVIE